MFSKGRLEAEDIFRKKERFTSSCLTRPRANGARGCACRLSALAIPQAGRLLQGQVLKRYVAVFGSNFQAGTKLWEGDRRTPEGSAKIRTGDVLALFYPWSTDWNIDHGGEVQVTSYREVPR